MQFLKCIKLFLTTSFIPGPIYSSKTILIRVGRHLMIATLKYTCLNFIRRLLLHYKCILFYHINLYYF